MNSEQIYLLSSKLKSSTFQVQSIGLNQQRQENDLFDEHKLLIGEYSNIKFPVIFKHKYGHKLLDVLDTGWPGLFLISKNLTAILEKSSLTGWRTYEIIIFDKNGQEIKGYQGFSVIGKCGKLEVNKKMVFEKQLIPKGPVVKYYKGFNIDCSKWDGSDFFVPENNLSILTSQYAFNILESHNISNLKFEDIRDLETDHYTSNNFH